jgi:hypothetical protein
MSRLMRLHDPGRSVVGLVAALLLTGVASLGVPGSASAQQAGDPPPTRETIAEDTIQLVFEREVFAYPSHARRNPFRPLTGADVGPRFEQLSLLGVIVSPDPGGSVALLGVAGAQQGRSATHRVRVGERLGNVRVLAIRPREIDVEVEEFGLTERATMRLRRSAPEAERDEIPVEDGTEAPTQGDTITPPPDTAAAPVDGTGGDAAAGGSGAGSDPRVGLNGNGGR